MSVCVDNEKCKSDTVCGVDPNGQPDLATGLRNGSFGGKVWYDLGTDLLKIWDESAQLWLAEDETTSLNHLEVNIEEL